MIFIFTMNFLVFVVTLSTVILHVFAFPKVKKHEATELKAVEDVSRIINGQPAKPGQFPWQVANHHILQNQSMICGAALICNRWVLTAAHCVQGSPSFILQLGSVHQNDSAESGRVSLKSKKAYVHELYNPDNLENDVALIKLPKRIKYTDRIKPIRLSNKYMKSDQDLIVSGWGRTKDNTTFVSPILNYVNLKTIENEECAKFYDKKWVKLTTLCCKGSSNHSTCHGDSGGPLVEKRPNGQYEHVGIVSFVPKDGCTIGGPSGFARTASYVPWIKKVIGKSCKLE